MEISVMLSAATGYILRAVAQSDTMQQAKEEILGRFWKWIKPSFIKEIPEIKARPDAPETTALIQRRLLELIAADDRFLTILSQRLAEVKEPLVTEKNIVKQDINRVKRILIGDKEPVSPEHYDRKCIVEGNVSDADEFILGDGH